MNPSEHVRIVFGREGSYERSSSLLARNVFLNLAGQLLILLTGLFTIPFIVRGLGNDAFGLLSLVLAVFAYFGFFDFGLGRAATKFVSEHLGRDEKREITGIVWTSLVTVVIFGTFGGAVLWGLAPLLAERAFNIPVTLLRDAKDSFRLIALALPSSLAGASLRGLLEAKQRFDLVNAIQVPSSTLNFLIPAATIPLGFSIPQIVQLLVVMRLVSALAFWKSCLSIQPSLRQDISFELGKVRQLMVYGGWLTVSGIAGSFLVYLDRILLASLLSVAAVAYYAAPYEMVTRLWVVPGSLVTTLFPKFSAIGRTNSRSDLEHLYLRSTKYLLLFLGPCVLVLAISAGEILRAWLGVEFAANSTIAFRILAVGVFANSLAWIPFSFLQGFGRPDITAKFHLAQLPVYAVMAWLLIREMGIAGAALAWAIRMGLEAIFLFAASWVVCPFPLSAINRHGLSRGIGAFGALVVCTSSLAATARSEIRIPVTAMLVAFFALAVWRYVLDTMDRRFIMSGIRQISSVHEIH